MFYYNPPLGEVVTLFKKIIVKFDNMKIIYIFVFYKFINCNS